MIQFEFVKMQALGNDFIVIDAIRQTIHLESQAIIALADRHYGIGCDQILLAEPANKADFFYRIYNADGSEANQCGNGARCIAKFVIDQGLVQKSTLTFTTRTGNMYRAHLEEDGQIAVDMGEPSFEPLAIPIALPSTITDLYTLDIQGKIIEFAALSLGNPHAVIFKTPLDKETFKTIAPLLATHPFFLEGANVSFMMVKDRHHLMLWHYERGAGETLACGSAACAAAAVALKHGLADSPILVSMRGGRLKVFAENGHIWSVGPAFTVFDGAVKLDDIDRSYAAKPQSIS